MQATTCFPDCLPHAILQEAARVFDAPVAFHPANGVFYSHANGRDLTLRRVFRGRECPARRFLLGVAKRAPRQKASPEALSWRQTTASWQGVPGELRHALLRRLAFRGGAQEDNVTGLLAHQEGVERVMRLRAAVLFFLCRRIFRTLEGPFRTIMPTRGGVEGASGMGFVRSGANASAVRAGRRSWSAHVRFNAACTRGIHWWAFDWDIPHSCPWSAWIGLCFQ
jgi:hypothetical protein